MQKPWMLMSVLLSLSFFVGRSVAAEGDGAAAQTNLKRLQDQLGKKYADRDCDREMTDLVGELAKLKYALAKQTVYQTVFFWFGFDDTMTTHPRLFTLKEKLEKDLNKRALAAAGNLKDVKTHCMVFLNNRKELAANPETEPQYSALVRIETATRLQGDGSRERKQLAAKLKIPAGRVGLQYGIEKQGNDSFSFVNNIDERLGTQPAHFLMWQVCEFLKHDHDANDDRFLRWAVDNRRLERGLASELVPELFPPEKRPDYAVHLRDAKHLAVKIFDRLKLAELKQFTHRNHGSFKTLLDSKVLSQEDGAKIALHNFEGFSLRKDAGFSRRYHLNLHYDDNNITAFAFNHLGEVVDEKGETDTSTDIPADVKIMWSVDVKGRSPQEAIEAASRVFNTVKLKGMHRDKIFKLIGDPSLRPKGIYNRPFHPAGKDEHAFRFDTGSYGWQFNLSFDEKGNCKTVTRKWIH